MPSIFDKVRQGIKNPEIDIDQQIELPNKKKEMEKSSGKIFQEASNQSLPRKQIPKVQQEQTQFPFDQENDLEREIERNQARTLSRGIETIAGLPGDIQSFAKQLTGFDAPIMLPTSSELQKGIEKVSGGYLAPQKEHEEKADELAKDITSFAIPGSGRASFVRNLGIPVLSNAAKELAGKFGASENVQSAIKVGTMFLFDLLNARQSIGKGGARKFANDLFQESEKRLPQGVSNAQKMESSLKDLKSTLESGGSAPSTQSALTKIDEILGNINNGKIENKWLLDSRKKINELIESGGGFDYFPKPKVKERAIFNLNKVKNEVIDQIDTLGKQHPEFGAYNKAANDAYAAWAGSNKVSNFLRKNFGDKIENPAVKMALGLAGSGGVAAGLKFFPLSTAASVAAFPLYHSFKIVNRIINSETLKDYYGNILKYSLQGNIPQTAQNIKALERKLDQEEKEHQNRISELKKRSKANKRKNH